jgi:hypothetical protein
LQADIASHLPILTSIVSRRRLVHVANTCWVSPIMIGSAKKLLAPLLAEVHGAPSITRIRTLLWLADLPPEGDYWLAVTLPPDEYGRKVIFRNLSLFMAWKQALGFTLASELTEPDAVYCVGITTKKRYACLARVRREPKPWAANNFGKTERLSEGSIDPMLLDLPPRGARVITARDVTTFEKWFGAKGKFPAVKIETGERGL